MRNWQSFANFPDYSETPERGKVDADERLGLQVRFGFLLTSSKKAMVMRPLAKGMCSGVSILLLTELRKQGFKRCVCWVLLTKDTSRTR